MPLTGQFAELWYFLIVTGIAYLGSGLITPPNIRFSLRNNIIADPNERSIHTEPIPTAGGLGFGLVIILIQIVLGTMLVALPMGSMLIKLGIISLPVIGLGLFDDIFHCRVRYKLPGQVLIALLMFYAGFRVTYLTNPLGELLHLNWSALPVTVLWFLLIMNAINLIDGLDGLAAGISCIVGIVLAIIGFMTSNMMILTLTAILIGSNAAFLKYNFYPARIFMGDTGSLLIGLNIAAISTAGATTYKGITTMTLLVPVIALAIPLIDTGLAVFRRIGKGSIFKADKSHLHHYLLKLGWSQKTIALVTYFITCLFGLAAIGFSFSSHKILFSLLVLLMAVLVIIAYYIIHKGQKQ